MLASHGTPNMNECASSSIALSPLFWPLKIMPFAPKQIKLEVNFDSNNPTYYIVQQCINDQHSQIVKIRSLKTHFKINKVRIYFQAFSNIDMNIYPWLVVICDDFITWDNNKLGILDNKWSKGQNQILFNHFSPSGMTPNVVRVVYNSQKVEKIFQSYVIGHWMPLLKKNCDELHTFIILLIVTIFCNLLQNSTMPMERNKLPLGFSWWLLAFTYNNSRCVCFAFQQHACLCKWSNFATSNFAWMCVILPLALMKDWNCAKFDTKQTMVLT